LREASQKQNSINFEYCQSKMKINTETQPYFVLFDGQCNLCNGAVQFIIRHDKKNRFVFASLQSEVAKKLLNEIQVPSSLETIVLIKGNKHFEKSDAALEIAKNLSGLWPLVYAFKIIPRFLRDVLYKWVAKNRYTWFGKRNSCLSPSPDLRARFLD
jgi:predicted DCC family thiol-disulfide oxidoreductase YuxK